MIELILKYFNKLTFNGIIDFFQFIIPVILTVWAVFYIRRSSFYYIERSNIKLYDDVIKKIQGISIKYKEEDINENLILFNGTIIFKGHNDIKADEIDKELTIFSKDTNAIWKHFEITKTSTDFTPKFNIVANKVIIEKSLLKSNDFISFAGLLDSKNNQLTVGHRIYNIIPSSINFKENDLTLYRIGASFLTFLLVFLFSFKVYTNYKFDREKSTSATLSKVDKSGKKTSKKDSILFRSFDFRTEFYLNNNKINIDTLSKQYKKKWDNKKNLVENANQKQLDSLTEKFKKNRTEKNEIVMLRKFIDNFSISFSNLVNPYDEIKHLSDKKLLELLTDNKVKNGTKYKINDSITVQFNDTTVKVPEDKTKSESISKDIDYFAIIFSALEYLFSLLIIVLMVILWYKYFRLLRLKKMYIKNVG